MHRFFVSIAIIVFAEPKPWTDGRIIEASSVRIGDPVLGRTGMVYTIEFEWTTIVAWEMAADEAEPSYTHLRLGETVRFQESKKILVFTDRRGKTHYLAIQKKNHRLLDSPIN